ncbi:MAG: ERF family protein [Sphaerochaeta sp.]|jgi:hypothetical protein|nr:ERF family protein [Sphaerochaeta sp.]
MTGNKRDIVRGDSPPTEVSVEVARDPTVSLMEQAIKSNATVEMMGKLMDMRREFRAEQAEQAFHEAMSKFQSECPIIGKTKQVKNNDGARAYSYAPIEDIIETARPLLKENGFSYQTLTETLDGKVTSTVLVTHVGGHKEASSMTVPMTAGTRLMSAPQVVAATLTFAKRYAFLNAFGITTGGEDTDADERDAAKDCDGCGKPRTLTDFTASTGEVKHLCAMCLMKEKKPQVKDEKEPF